TAERTRRRRARVNGGAPAPRDGAVTHAVSSCLDVRRDAAGDYWACHKCGADLGDADGNYKDQCVREDKPVAASNPLIGDPQLYIDDPVEFRQFYCRGCGALIDNEVAVCADPVLRDVHYA
ncbi:MAG: acetone carboxylase subunit gamma, partial [Gammaproteobacteria bacterium]